MVHKHRHVVALVDVLAHTSSYGSSSALAKQASGNLTRSDSNEVFTRLLTFPNVLITGHQGFFAEEALARIAETTLQNVTAFETGEGEIHHVPGVKQG